MKPTEICKAAIGEGIDREKLPKMAYYTPWTTTGGVFHEVGGSRVINFQAEDSYKDITAFLEKIIPDKSTLLNSMDEVKEWALKHEKMQQPSIIFFISKDKPPPLVKALQLDFLGKASIGVVTPAAGGPIGEKLKIHTTPAVVSIEDAKSMKVEEFEGKMKKENLWKFIRTKEMKIQQKNQKSFDESEL